jgi:hypothetical protein
VITTKTVLVLGAGASKPYFPTGNELVRQIRDFAGSPKAEEWWRLCEGWLAKHNLAYAAYLGEAIRAMKPLCRELTECRPDSIDQFLERRQDMAEVGRLVISILLLTAERESEGHLWSDAAGTHWYSFLKTQLVNPPKELGQDQLRIISFNYDRSLEHYLFRSLKPLYVGTLTDEAHANAMKQFQFLHIYGSLGPLPWQSATGTVPYGSQGYGEILTAAKNVKVLHQGTDDAVQQNFKTAQEWLKWADKILFLGFGFHEDNVERLALREIIPSKKGVLATCLGLDATSRNRVEFRRSSGGPVRNMSFLDPKADCYPLLHDHAVLS